MRSFVSSVMLFLAVSCAAPTKTVPPADPQPSMQRCTNDRYGFTVTYPAGWHTNSGEVIPACSAFDPEPVQIPAQSEMPFGIAVVISAQDVAFDRAPEPQFERVLASERVTIAGRPAMRLEVESTGEGLADRGLRTTRYAIDLGGGRSLIATTNATDGSYEANKAVLAQMLDSLVLR